MKHAHLKKPIPVPLGEDLLEKISGGVDTQPEIQTQNQLEAPCGTACSGEGDFYVGAITEA